MSTSDQKPGLPPTDIRADRLDSWKEIAVYLNRDVRTVQRWEKKEALPVHRHQHEKLGTVYAYKSELDAWWRSSESKIAADDAVPAAAEDDSAALDPTEEFEMVGDPGEPKAWWQRRWVWAVAAVALIVAGLIVWKFIPRPPHTARILVLPLDNLSGDPQQAYFSTGMTEEIIAELAKLNPAELGVIARKTAERYPGRPIEQMRKELDVDYVVEGSVFRAGDRVRITAQLIRTEDQTHLWAKSYESDLRDVIGVQREVANEIAHEVSVHARSVPQAPKVNPEAYDAFLRGRYFWNKRGPDTLRKSMAYFEEAIQKDPNYAPAYAGLADGFALLGSTQNGALPPNIAFPKAQAAAEKALALDDTVAEAHASLGYIRLVYDRDPAAAKKEFDRAIELDPHYATAHQWLGLYYVITGEPEKAIESVERASKEDPLSLAVNISLAEAYYFSRQYDKAIEHARTALELDEHSALAHYNLGRAYEQKRLYPEAIAEFEKARLDAPVPATLVPLAHAYAISGKQVEARAALKELERLATTQYVPALYYGVIYTGLNDRDHAFEALERAYDEHCDYLVFLDRDPMADTLRPDPRFAALVQKLALKK